ncbi:FIG00387961: hypothetical protein [hydrothermal vent metagenome]|uniref:Alpha/beta hydrolase n=1 Tax=hydrothermal vent metagenome TaxID=652676 RepID=A0A3B1E418_9ZZZZ
MYFSGFSLKNECSIFDQYLIKNDFAVSGFSFGAQKAVEYALTATSRIDTLQLFSPAYFNDKDSKYKRMQLMYFNKNSQVYCDNFLNNCEISQENKKKYFCMGTAYELKTLLNYNWSEYSLNLINNKNINIEVYLGNEDKIINTKEALNFFKNFADVYYVKNVGHTLTKLLTTL